VRVPFHFHSHFGAYGSILLTYYVRTEGELAGFHDFINIALARKAAVKSLSVDDEDDILVLCLFLVCGDALSVCRTKEGRLFIKFRPRQIVVVVALQGLGLERGSFFRWLARYYGH